MNKKPNLDKWIPIVILIGILGILTFQHLEGLKSLRVFNQPTKNVQSEISKMEFVLEYEKTLTTVERLKKDKENQELKTKQSYEKYQKLLKMNPIGITSADMPIDFRNKNIANEIKYQENWLVENKAKYIAVKDEAYTLLEKYKHNQGALR
ncbi:hypothetical protein [Halarcobacter bivalviorum]|uniref:hypothetical protein n=1 Tax=Halarcobacter bivalviorum TaxID=663364 RepID=UPI00100A443B|nr:hypothetical protein [Halarcobacter bivalviorum]RXK05375.1 hypothetical protein CRU97_08515 [Halarcobacter bivalviorum]